MAGSHSSNLVHPVPIISGTLLKRSATSVCNATHTHWCSSCSCERHARLHKGQLPDTGMGNRISKLLSFAGISESLGRHVLVFWPTLGNWGRLSHLEDGASTVGSRRFAASCIYHGRYAGSRIGQRS